MVVSPSPPAVTVIVCVTLSTVHGQSVSKHVTDLFCQTCARWEFVWSCYNYGRVDGVEGMLEENNAIDLVHAFNMHTHASDYAQLWPSNHWQQESPRIIKHSVPIIQLDATSLASAIIDSIPHNPRDDYSLFATGQSIILFYLQAYTCIFSTFLLIWCLLLFSLILNLDEQTLGVESNNKLSSQPIKKWHASLYDWNNHPTPFNI